MVVDSNLAGDARTDVANAPDDTGVLSVERRWVAPLLGLIFVALLVISFVLTSDSPGSSVGGLTVISYYLNHRAQQNTSAVLIIVSIPVGLFFFGLLREYLRQSRAARPFATIAFVGAAVFAAGGCVASGLQFALADVPGQLSPSAAQAMNVMSNDLSFPLIVAGVSVMQLGFGIAVLRSRLLPTWLGWLAVAIGVVAAAGPIGFFGFLASAVWILLASALMYERLAATPRPRSHPEP